MKHPICKNPIFEFEINAKHKNKSGYSYLIILYVIVNCLENKVSYIVEIWPKERRHFADYQSAIKYFKEAKL